LPKARKASGSRANSATIVIGGQQSAVPGFIGEKDEIRTYVDDVRTMEGSFVWRYDMKQRAVLGHKCLLLSFWMHLTSINCARSGTVVGRRSAWRRSKLAVGETGEQRWR
jgi:hypothetical protein